jgi:hypothetical protein
MTVLEWIMCCSVRQGVTIFPYVDKADTRAHVVETVSGLGTYVTNLTRGSSSWTFGVCQAGSCTDDVFRRGTDGVAHVRRVSKGIVDDWPVSEPTRYNRSIGVFANYCEAHRGLSLRKDS